MKDRTRVSQFGWQGDRGLGDRLIRQILAGTKTATACPKILYSAQELGALRASVGHTLTVIDKRDHPRCTILQLEVFETSFGEPDKRLVQGEGFRTARAFKQAHQHVWDDLLEAKGTSLGDDTILIAEVFKKVDGRELPRSNHRASAGRQAPASASAGGG